MNRTPKVYTTNASYCTVYASFLASAAAVGGSDVTSRALDSDISWSMANPYPSTGTFTLTPSSDKKSCTVQMSGSYNLYGTVDVTCTYQNSNMASPVSETVTVGFRNNLVDEVDLVCSG